LIEEEIDQEDLDRMLRKTLEDEDLWRKYKSLFDKHITPTNLNVRYMRSLLILAGPILEDFEDPESGFEGISDLKEQNTIVTAF
jgi:hypothetical protein